MKMNREIKFRAWIRPGNMQYNIVPWQWDFCIDSFYVLCTKSTGSGVLGHGGDTAQWEAHGFRYMDEAEKSLMQYTGLKDKNGVEIYEGDIIRFSGFPSEVNGVVEYETQACAFWIKWTEYKVSRYKELRATYGGENYSNDSLEIIGNIHQNPDLLT